MEETNVRMYTFYKDLVQSSDSIENLTIEQANRDSVIMKTLFTNYKIPYFPMSINDFNKYKSIIEQVSLENKQLCMAFIIDNKCTVINNNQYYFFSNLFDAQVAFSRNSDAYIQIFNKYL